MEQIYVALRPPLARLLRERGVDLQARHRLDHGFTRVRGPTLPEPRVYDDLGCAGASAAGLTERGPGMMRDLFQEGRSIDAARVRAEEPAAHDVVILSRAFFCAHVFRALFGVPRPVRCQSHR
jgi:hypothetical protein